MLDSTQKISPERPKRKQTGLLKLTKYRDIERKTIRTRNKGNQLFISWMR
jgi:hypothetical protein